MPHSDNDQSPAPAKVSDPDIDEDEDPELEEEEEEEEVEENIEEWEEEEEEGEEEEEEEEPEEEEEEEQEDEDEEVNDEEEEEEEGRDEVDMDISDSPIRVHDHHNDVRQDIKSEGLDEQLAPYNALSIEESSDRRNQELVVGKRDAEILSGKKTSMHHIESHTDAKAHLCNSEIMDDKVTNSSLVAGEETADAIPMRDRFSKEVNSVMKSEGEIKQVDIQPRNDKKQMESRSSASEIGTRITSPVAETSDRNKRPAIICDFFAKGWCIRGSSCRFIHIKDNQNNSHPQPEGDVAAANCNREVRLDEGLRDITERSRLPGIPDPMASSSGSSFAFSSHLSSEKIQFTENIGIQGRHHFHEKRKFPSDQREESNVGDSTDEQKLHSSKDDLSFLSSHKDVGRDGQTQNWPADDYNNSPINKGTSIFKNGLHSEYGFFINGSTVSSGKYSRVNTSPHSGSMEELAGIWSQRVHSDHTSGLVSHSLNSSSSTSLLTTGLFPTSRISSWTGFSLPSSYSYLDANPLGTQKLLHSNRDYRGSSPFSISELKNLPLTSISLCSGELKTKISSNDWEPSVPFRPSFILPPAFLSSSGSQYDPLRDSIELPKLANISLEASFYSEGATAANRLHQQIHGESVSGTLRPACDGDTKSMSSHNAFHEKVLDNSCYTREHNSPVTEAETVGTSVVCQNGTMTREENPLGLSHPKGSTKPNKVGTYGDSRHQSDGSRHKKDIKVDRLGEDNEVDVEHFTDGDVNQESKAMRHFRAALVDLVKELLKPKWREGRLSKDAHNKIVKKAVDKVLSSIQPHQIPATVETVMQYLSFSHPKISKLVEGYVDKYGKS